MTDQASPGQAVSRTADDLSQGQLFWLRFRKHRLAMFGLAFVLAAFLMAGFAEFLAPHDPGRVNAAYQYAPPQLPRFFDAEDQFHWRPFVYPMKRSFDLATGLQTWAFDTDTRL